MPTGTGKPGLWRVALSYRPLPLRPLLAKARSGFFIALRVRSLVLYAYSRARWIRTLTGYGW